ncbi:MAG: VWA domain-containing protein [Chloroflexi bacterium]|nr:VWA domain-containing protein [Chloroflexota bacterium]
MPEDGLKVFKDSEDYQTVMSEGGLEIRRKTDLPTPNNRVIKADFVFVIDTTGSMDHEIVGLMKTCEKFANAVAQRNIDYRMGIVAFGDLTIQPPDKMVAFPLIANAQRIAHAFGEVLEKHRTSGGGNTGESSVDALWQAAEGFRFRQDAVKVFLLFTDEPPLDPDTKQRTMAYTIQEFKKRQIVCFCITGPDEGFKRLAKETKGDWFLISAGTDFLGILNKLFQRVADVTVEVGLRLPSGSGTFLHKSLVDKKNHLSLDGRGPGEGEIEAPSP